MDCVYIGVRYDGRKGIPTPSRVFTKISFTAFGKGRRRVTGAMLLNNEMKVVYVYMDIYIYIYICV